MLCISASVYLNHQAKRNRHLFHFGSCLPALPLPPPLLLSLALLPLALPAQSGAQVSGEPNGCHNQYSSHSGAHNNDDCFNIYWDRRGGGGGGGGGRGWVAKRAGHSHKTVSVDGDLHEQERNMIIHVLLPTARELLVTSTFMMVS